MPVVSYQLRFECTEGSTEKASHLLGRLLSIENINYITYFVAPYNDKVICFKFSNQDIKDKVVLIENLETKLRKINCIKYHGDANVPNQDATDRTAFVFGLSPHYFYCFTTEDGFEHNETLDDKLNEFMTELKKVEPNIESNHFITHTDNRGHKLAPKSMRITFKDKDSAKTFIESDTKFELGYLNARQKIWHTDISIIQCKVCRKTGHRKGNAKCDKRPRCPRCLSLFHFQPLINSEDCEPVCWEHGEGHSSGSDKCPSNIKFKKQQRTILNQNKKIENQTANTAPDHKQFHQDIIKLQEKINTNSYSAALKNQIRPNPTNPTIPIQSNPINSSAFASAYIAACISEAYDPGSFQEVIDEYAELNDLPKIKHPRPRTAVLRALAPEAPLPSENIQTATETEHASTVVDAQLSIDHTDANSSQPSPINTRSLFDNKIDKAIKNTETVKLVVRVNNSGNPCRDREFQSVLHKMDDKKISIDEFNYYVKDQIISFKQAETSNKLTYELLSNAAELVKFKNRYIHFELMYKGFNEFGEESPSSNS